MEKKSKLPIIIYCVFVSIFIIVLFQMWQSSNKEFSSLEILAIIFFGVIVAFTGVYLIKPKLLLYGMYLISPTLVNKIMKKPKSISQKITKVIRNFKILFTINIAYQLLVLVRIIFKLYPEDLEVYRTHWATFLLVFFAVGIFIAFLIYLHNVATLLKLNSIIKVYPWVLVVLQIVLYSRIIIPGLIIPIYLLVKSKELLKLETIKTYDEKKFMLPPK